MPVLGAVAEGFALNDCGWVIVGSVELSEAEPDDVDPVAVDDAVPAEVLVPVVAVPLASRPAEVPDGFVWVTPAPD